MLFNAIVPKELGFQNRDMKKKALGELVFECYRRPGSPGTVPFLDRLKEFGFRNATRGGVSIGIEDLHIPAEKETLLEEAEERVERFQRAYSDRQHHERRALQQGHRHLDAREHRHRRRDGASAMREVERRVQPGVHDVRLRLARYRATRSVSSPVCAD